MESVQPKRLLDSGRMDPLLAVGFNNTVAANKVVAILTPNSAPMKRLKDDAKKAGRLVDATCGRKTRSIIVMESNHVVLSAVQADTVSARYTALAEKHRDGTPLDLESEEDTKPRKSGRKKA